MTTTPPIESIDRTPKDQHVLRPLGQAYYPKGGENASLGFVEAAVLSWFYGPDYATIEWGANFKRYRVPKVLPSISLPALRACFVHCGPDCIKIKRLPPIDRSVQAPDV